MSEVSTCLWFGKNAESAVRFYVSIVPGSAIHHIQRSPGAWPGGEAGDVILISFRLGGQSFQALNGGAPVEYGTAVSISVQCADQAEIDRLWAALTANGGAEIMCGWLRDRWGVPLADRAGGPPPPSGRPRSGRFCARLRRNAGHGETGRCRAGTRGGSVTRLL
jgi:predicted 3-demethylubiquinone-9 3-methyltransferase (glyoxalase superfamily)